MTLMGKHVIVTGGPRGVRVNVIAPVMCGLKEYT
jgi:hypothetical protein